MAAPKTLKNTVNPLSFNVPIADGSGKPTDEFTRKWLQQARTNASIPDLTTAAKVSAYLDLIGSAPGMLLERGATQWGGLASPADATKFLNGATSPAYAQVKDSDLSLSDITTNNATTARHGFVPKLPNDVTQFYNGIGAFSVPATGGGGAASIQDNGTTVYVALSDTDGQLILDGAGDPIFSPEVFPPSAIPPLVGVTDGSSAAAGVIGEFMASTVLVGAAVNLVDNVVTNIASITLTPGDWDVTIGAGITGAPSTTTTLVAATLHTTNNALSNLPGSQFQQPFPGGQAIFATQDFMTAIGPRRFNVTVNTSVYFNAYIRIAVSTAAAYGTIRARRVR